MNRATRFAIAAALFFLAVAAQGQAPSAFTLSAEPVCTVVNGAHRPAVRLQWSDSDGASQYDVYRDGVPLQTALTTDTTSYQDVSNDLSTSHTYQVHAVNSSGTTLSNTASASAPASTCPAPPPAPVLNGNAACDSSTSPKRPIVNLSWTASAGATSYDVVRNGDGIDNTPNTSTTDVGVDAGTTYIYFIRANNAGGSSESNHITIDVAADICGNPPGPFNATTSASCSSGKPKVTVSWTAAAGATSYVVDRNDGTVSPPLSASTFSYDDTTVTVETPYTYSVNALNASGSSQSNSFITVPANVCSGGPPTAPSAVTGSVVCSGTSAKVHLAWSGATNATSYSVLRDGNVIASGITAVTYDDANVTNGQTHSYVIRSVNAAGSADSSPPVTILNILCEAPPSAPVLSASTFCFSSSTPAVHLTWTASTGAQSYDVVRNTEVVGVAIPAPATTFDDVTATAGQTYTYHVNAVNTNGNTPSNNVIVTVTAPQCGTPQTAPDLGVTSVTLSPTAVKVGDTMIVTVAIANSGNASASASTLRIRISTQTTPQTSDFPAASIVVAPIAAGASTTITQPIKIPALPMGTYYILVFADDDHTTGDTNSANNSGHSAPFAILGIPQHRRAVGH